MTRRTFLLLASALTGATCRSRSAQVKPSAPAGGPARVTLAISGMT
jgi:hypothetical protein